MRTELVEAGWTEEHWNRITGAVQEEVQRARVAAQILPTFGPPDESAVSFADYRLNFPVNVPPPPPNRITTLDTPDHPLTSIAVPVYLTSADVHDPNLQAALTKFRRAANILARLEDAVVFNDRILAGRPAGGIAGIPTVDTVQGGGPYPGNLGAELGLLPLDLGPAANPPAPATPILPRQTVAVGLPFPPNNPPVAADGALVANAVVRALTLLENAGFSRPFACALSPYFYQAVYVPNANLIEAKDTILPILNGPLVRSSAIRDMTVGLNPNVPIPYGVVVALGGDLVGIRVAVDVKVRFVQTTDEPRYLFRVSERIGLRISDPQAIVVLTP